MKKIILTIDQFNTVLDDDGNTIGALSGTYKEYVPDNSAEVTLQLVKQGVTVDEIIKLKNSELI